MSETALVVSLLDVCDGTAGTGSRISELKTIEVCNFHANMIIRVLNFVQQMPAYPACRNAHSVHFFVQMSLFKIHTFKMYL